MNGFLWLIVVLGLLWFCGTLVSLGVLAERERLLNPGGERGLAWFLALLFSSALWFIVAGLWPSSRPVPPQPRRYEFAELDVRSTWEWRGAVNENVGSQTGATPIDTTASLALCGRIQVGQRVFVNSVGILLERHEKAWHAVLCGCRYNFSGFPVVVCRQHRSDADPQGEPDDSEGDVGL